MQSDLTGRFAPSPTGDLHFGSLLAALASFCDIKQQAGRWRVRIDDIDGPRSVKGSAAAILKTLEYYGFEWDDSVLWQSQRLARYSDALATLVQQKRIFTCNCSRRKLPTGKIYPGNCKERIVGYTHAGADYRVDDHALRCRLQGSVRFDDAVQGVQQLELEKTVGDIVVWRRDGLVSYALACAVDDAQSSTHVVRGADLLDSTSAQVGIMQALGIPVPRYAHIPVAVDANGDKLSKHSRAQAISTQEPLQTLLHAWHFLGQAPIEPDSLSEFWHLAPTLWQIHKVPAKGRLSV